MTTEAITGQAVVAVGDYLHNPTVSVRGGDEVTAGRHFDDDPQE